MNEIAHALGIPPAALPLIIGALYIACKAISRLIPDTSTGWQGALHTVDGIMNVDIGTCIAPGVAIAAVATAATAPIRAKIEAETGIPVPASVTNSS